MFTDDAGRDYTLSAGSPAIDAGVAHNVDLPYKGDALDIGAFEADPALFTDGVVSGTVTAGGNPVANVPVTAGGRVLGVTAVAADLETALATAYERADRITFRTKFCRRDIGKRALAAKQ